MITHVHFTLLNSKADQYSLAVYFERSDHTITKIAFRIFSSQSQRGDFERYEQMLRLRSSPICCDVQPINGHYQKKTGRFLKDLIRIDDLNNLEEQNKYLNQHHSEDADQLVKLIVLDLKDSKERYESLDDIKTGETRFVNFLAGTEPVAESHRKAFHQHIRKNNVGFVMREGKLKCQLLRLLNDEQRTYFQERKTGQMRLCQLCEIIMNFFKRSFCVQSQGETSHTFEPQDYFFSISKEELQQCEKKKDWSRLPLLTLYPGYYEESYGEKSLYFQTVLKMFYAEFHYDECTKTTAIRIFSSRFC